MLLKLCADLGRTNKSNTFLGLSLHPFHTFFLLFSFFSVFPLSSGTSDRNYPLSPPFLSGYNRCPVTRFLRAMNWPGEARCCRYLHFHVASCLSYPPISSFWMEYYLFIKILPHTSLFSIHKGAFAFSSHKLCLPSSLLQRADPSIALTCIVSVDLAELKILHAAPAVIRLWRLLISVCSVLLRNQCRCSSVITSIYTTSAPGFKECFMVFRDAPT